MKAPTYHKNEHGVALVISLMFLAILGMLGTTAYVMTSTDLKIGRNYQQASQAFYGADAGVRYVLATIENDLKNGTTVANGTTDILPTTVGASEPFTAASPSGFNLTFSNITKVSDSPGVYSFTSTSQNPDGSRAEIDILFKKLDHDPAFDVGMLSEGDISINGNANVDGGMHANGNVSQTGGGGNIDGPVSAVGSVSSGSCKADCTDSAGADRIDVPLIENAKFVEWKTKSQTAPNIYDPGASCTYSDPGAGNIYFCDGDLDFSNNLSTSAESDVTIIATGNITARGSSIKKTDGKIGLALIAGGNIEFRGGGGAVLNATFWCNGDYQQNGTGTVAGSIVAGGDITRNGTFNFIQDNNIDNDNLPPSNECNVIAWSDSRH
jgi:Tfp pilus assembly protein PilX